MSAKARKSSQRAAQQRAPQPHAPAGASRPATATLPAQMEQPARLERRGAAVREATPLQRVRQSSPARPPARRYASRKRFGLRFKVGLAVVAAVLALGVIFALVHAGFGGGGAGQTGQYAYTVGDPGTGAQAPAVVLPATTGGTFDLSQQRGKTVLLYFQEGLTCEPCWTQLKDIDSHLAEFHALGIDEVVSVTTDPLDAITQKARDEGITTPVLSDANLSASNAYHTNQYGMMGASRDGHSFVVVGPDGRIEWRADFGGAPNYTMYVPVSTLLTDLRQGLHK